MNATEDSRIEATLYEQRLHRPCRVQKYKTRQNEEDANGNCYRRSTFNFRKFQQNDLKIHSFENKRIEIKLNKIMVDEDTQKNLFTQQILNNLQTICLLGFCDLLPPPNSKGVQESLCTLGILVNSYTNSLQAKVLIQRVQGGVWVKGSVGLGRGSLRISWSLSVQFEVSFTVFTFVLL